MVGPRYFSTMGITILRGRGFDDADVMGTAPVAVVSQELARTYWRDRSPIGACIQVQNGDSCVEVVGVAASAKYSDLLANPDPLLYLAAPQVPASAFRSTIFVRTLTDPADFVGQIRSELSSLHANIPFIDIELMTRVLHLRMFRWDVAAKIFTVLGAFSSLLAAVGLFGVVSFMSSQRARELSVRSALGANRSNLLHLVISDGVKLAGVGVAAGSLIALLIGVVLSSQLYSVSPADPASYFRVALLLVLTGLAAALPSAFKAAGTDPAQVLRGE
jgi:hypothetical protein